MQKYILDEHGSPIRCDDVIAWGRWFEAADSLRRVANDVIGDVRVSTVFLGLDHNWLAGPPILWETMIFGGEHDGYQERYTSLADAERGHAVALALVHGGQAHD